MTRADIKSSPCVLCSANLVLGSKIEDRLTNVISILLPPPVVVDSADAVLRYVLQTKKKDMMKKKGKSVRYFQKIGMSFYDIHIYFAEF